VIFYTKFHRTETDREQTLSKHSAARYFVKPDQLEALKEAVDELVAGVSDAEEVTRTVTMVSQDQKESGLLTIPTVSGATTKTWQDAHLQLGGAYKTVAEELLKFSQESPARTRDTTLLPILQRLFRAQTVSKSKILVLASMVTLLLVGVLSWSVWFRFTSGNRRSLAPNENQGLGSSKVAERTDSLPSSNDKSTPDQREERAATAISSPLSTRQRSRVGSEQKPVQRSNDGISQNEDTRGSQPGQLTWSQTEPLGKLSLLISDISKPGEPPFLRQSTRPSVSQEILESSISKPLVIRIIVGSSGEVIEAVPVKLDPNQTALNDTVLEAVAQWKFSPARRHKPRPRVKYFSFKPTRE
jgi:hypothetical protein